MADAVQPAEEVVLQRVTCSSCMKSCQARMLLLACCLL